MAPKEPQSAMNKPSRIAEAHRLDLPHRPRRNRKAEWARRLIRERVLTTDDLIWPLFLIEGEKTRVAVCGDAGRRPAQRRRGGAGG